MFAPLSMALSALYTVSPENNNQTADNKDIKHSEDYLNEILLFYFLYVNHATKDAKLIVRYCCSIVLQYKVEERMSKTCH